MKRQTNVFLKRNSMLFEKKKSTGRRRDKDSDRIRLQCLTKSHDKMYGVMVGKYFQNMFVDMDWEYIMR